MKNIVFMHRFPWLASYRYRSEMPAAELRRRGYTASVMEGEADVLVLSKPCEKDLELARQATLAGASIVADICDDHFERHPELYKETCALADKIVVGSDVMAGRVREYVNRDSVVIGDPYEMEECAPHAEGEDFVWFGHQRNLAELAGVANHLEGYKLRVVTGPKVPPQCIAWSVETLKQVLAVSNVVALPTKPGNEYKSPNRLVNAIRAGCFAVCMSHPAYEEFKRFVWVGNFPTGLRWLKNHQHMVNDLVAQAQEFVRERYSPETIGGQWAQLFDSI